MIQTQVTIINKLGLHARAAAKFVSLCLPPLPAHIQAGKDGKLVDGKSIMSVMMLAAGKGTVLDLQIDGGMKKPHWKPCKTSSQTALMNPSSPRAPTSVTNHVVVSTALPDNCPRPGSNLEQDFRGKNGEPDRRNFANYLRQADAGPGQRHFRGRQAHAERPACPDAAHLLQSSPPKVRHILWKMIEEDNEGEVLNALSDEVRHDFLSEMEAAKVAELMEGLEDDDVADILQQLPDRITWEVLNSMDHQDRSRLQRVMHIRRTLPAG